tara:strand:+ start:133 stop:1269 length:1137 start_codon:yes stop_codon:yes gene_type:complete
MGHTSLIEHFSIIRDYRQSGKVDHKLTDIILLVVCGVISGAEGWEDITDFGKDRLDWLKQYGDFDNGIPSDDTIARVMGRLSPRKVQACFSAWMESCHARTEGQIIAIDGKTLRRSYDKSKRKGAIHMVSAFCVENSLVLAQRQTSEKSNEITAIPELLDLLEVKGCLLTIDAMGCQREIAEKIVSKGADYLLAVKGNQPRLAKAFEKYFPISKLNDFDEYSFSTAEKSHGRDETRIYIVKEIFDDFVDHSFEWKGMKSVGVCIGFRSKTGVPPNAEDVMIRYFISSAKLSPKRFSEAVRWHWHIENKLHWTLDVAFQEDACRVRRESAGENLAAIRHIALNFLKSENTFKAGIKRKQKKAARNDDYLSEVLAVPQFS